MDAGLTAAVPHAPNTNPKYRTQVQHQEQEQEQERQTLTQKRRFAQIETHNNNNNVNNDEELTGTGLGYSCSWVSNDNKTMMMHQRLMEMENQLLGERDDEERDAASTITNSEVYRTMERLMGPTQTPTPTQNQKPLTSSKQWLMEAASAISQGNLDAASKFLQILALRSFSNLNWNGKNITNSDQRFTASMISALKSRMQLPPHLPQQLFSVEHAESTRLLLHHCFCFNAAVTAANITILQSAFDIQNQKVNLSVVDFNIGNGMQYVQLLQLLSVNVNGMIAVVKITAVVFAERSFNMLETMVGPLLRQLALALGIVLLFNVVTLTSGIAELTRDSLGCDADERLAVNFVFTLSKVPDESVLVGNPRDELLRRVKALAPCVVTLAEQEMNANTAPFTTRVAESCSYYAALFESIESYVFTDTVRVKIETGLSRKINNTIACEGRNRVERCEVFGKWRARMSMAGYELKTSTESICYQLAPPEGFSVKLDNGAVFFAWKGKALTFASAWH
ncbi:scarecrow-like protein 8 [Abrus precatorius]|uniref:Scarecrow-like protein 8 n=1 Tax=Abrus precatorius TaxID=3816 RepID=A0A8B8KGJ3_ABRPR|nr:scarecrow-like protein 8 [Abrus precatorius]